MINLPPSGLAQVPLFPWLLWNLWKSINQALFEEKFFSEEETLLKSIREAISWKEAQSRRKIPEPVRESQATAPLSPESICCYVDAAWIEAFGDCEMGWHFTQANNVSFAQQSTHHDHVASALAAEALAVKNALFDALARGIRKLHVFSDCKVLISLLNSRKSTVELRGLLLDIRELDGSFIKLSFMFIPHVRNGLADTLVKSGLLPVNNASLAEV
ncbi:unnamed protein product [Arabis nemorensis]|uniref:RNase H type-1 domain-containing protein n=1 Tax=Arabis nemorensis TaxID=586526 RepID=A0A565BJJ6_9BRAS|nr:unnamed protein product [Arabis nemorensis]